jgi:uncharacterized membrane protein YkvA (DUF1232 family)
MSESSARRKPAPDIDETAGMVGGVIKQARLAWRLLRDARVPGWAKMIPIAGVLYLLSPIDLLPEAVVPLLGEVDDVVILMLAVKLFVDLSPPGVVREHLRDLFNMPRESRSGKESYIEVPYRVHEHKERAKEPES